VTGPPARHDTAKSSLEAAYKEARKWSRGAKLIGIAGSEGRDWSWTYAFTSLDKPDQFVTVYAMPYELRILSTAYNATEHQTWFDWPFSQPPPVGDFSLDSSQAAAAVRANATLARILDGPGASMAFVLMDGRDWACWRPFWESHPGPFWRIGISGADPSHRVWAFVDARTGQLFDDPAPPRMAERSAKVLLTVATPTASDEFDPGETRCHERVSWRVDLPAFPGGSLAYNVTDSVHWEAHETDFGLPISGVTLGVVLTNEGRPWAAKLRLTDGVAANVTMHWALIPTSEFSWLDGYGGLSQREAATAT